jgi:L-threonylcarbamoyladenylate synthase
LSKSSTVLPGPEEYKLAVRALEKGGIVAYPTETFYGLAVDPENKEALSALYRLKQRHPEKSFSLIVPDLSNLSSYVDEFPGASNILMNKFWPGPLTLIFQASGNALQLVTKKDNSIAVRISSHIVASTLCRFFGRAITASSANVSGEQALDNATSVRELWGDKLAYILDGGTTPGTKPSTIIRCDGLKCTIIRQGILSFDRIREVLPNHFSVCNQ